MQTALLNIIQHTTQAIYARQPLKEPYILQIAGYIQTLQLFIRLSFEEKLIVEKQYFILSDKIIELQKMAIGWLKSVRNN